MVSFRANRNTSRYLDSFDKYASNQKKCHRKQSWLISVRAPFARTYDRCVSHLTRSISPDDLPLSVNMRRNRSVLSLYPPQFMYTGSDSFVSPHAKFKLLLVAVARAWNVVVVYFIIIFNVNRIVECEKVYIHFIFIPSLGQRCCVSDVSFILAIWLMLKSGYVASEVYFQPKHPYLNSHLLLFI